MALIGFRSYISNSDASAHFGRFVSRLPKPNHKNHQIQKNFLAESRFKYLQKVKLVRLVGGIRKNSSLNRGIFLSTLFRYKFSGVLKWQTGVSPPIGSNLSVSFSHIFVLCPKWSQPHARGHRSFWSLFVNHFLHDLKTANAKGLARWYEWCRSSRTCILG